MSRSNSQPEQAFSRAISDHMDVMHFGKYSGETVQDILDNDPGYLLWLDANTDIAISSLILQEAEDKNRPDHMFKNYTKRDFDKFT